MKKMKKIGKGMKSKNWIDIYDRSDFEMFTVNAGIYFMLFKSRDRRFGIRFLLWNIYLGFPK